MKILVTGANGLVGRNIVRALLTHGHDLFALVRSPEKVNELGENQIYRWDYAEVPPAEKIKGMDAVVHLLGESVADKPWTLERKRQLVDSRLLSTRNLVTAIKALPPNERPKVFVSTSATGFYGDTQNSEVNESSPGKEDFLSQLCKDWESEARPLAEMEIRLVIMRLGLVLSKEGGFLSKMAPVSLGSGKQWMSWIHIQDVVRFVQMALETKSYQGVYNLVSPNPVTNSEMTRIFAQKMGFPFTIPAPSLALRVALGEMSSAILAGQRVQPKRLNEAGFQFQFTKLAVAMDDVYQNDGFLDSYHIVNQFVPLPKENIFPFFSCAENLEMITPPWLNFRVVAKSSEHIEKNSTIDYKLKVHGIPIRWKTLISEWQPGSYFVDDQVRGPYRKWHHRHTFESVNGGTLLRDEVTFQVPGSFLGKVLLTPFIRKDVEAIFSYRKKMINELYKQGKLV